LAEIFLKWVLSYDRTSSRANWLQEDVVFLADIVRKAPDGTPDNDCRLFHPGRWQGWVKGLSAEVNERCTHSYPRPRKRLANSLMIKGKGRELHQGTKQKIRKDQFGVDFHAWHSQESLTFTIFQNGQGHPDQTRCKIQMIMDSSPGTDWICKLGFIGRGGKRNVLC
jgi:hypothetical protein